MIKAKANVIALVALFGLSAAAHAEVLTIEGLTAANVPDFSTIETIAIDRFDGSDGQPLAFELEDQLSAATLFGQPYFAVIGGRSAVEPDATLSGNVTVDIDEYETTAKRNRCIARDDRDKCTERKNTVVDCLQRTISFRAQVRGIRYEDGRNIYSETFPKEDEQIICFGDDREFAKSDTVIRKMIGDTAREIRNDLAPKQYRREIRVLESRKGMAKADGKFFKAAVRMTKKDETEACRMWDEAASKDLVHISLAFNRGLCAERGGDLGNAISHYREAQSLSSKKHEVDQALTRVDSHQRALEEWDLRQSARSAVKNN